MKEGYEINVINNVTSPSDISEILVSNYYPINTLSMLFYSNKWETPLHVFASHYTTAIFRIKPKSTNQ